MPTAEIVAIGTELLLGESQDTNTKYLARQLRDVGIDIYRTSIVGDNAKRIEQIIREALARTNIVITTGGLGPTVDDPTREAIAAAFDVETEYHPELWDQILERFNRYNREPTKNNMRQAYIPAGAIPLTNTIGTAPAFMMTANDRVVISLPGVPREMELLTTENVIPFLIEYFHLTGTIKARVLHTAGVGESQVDEWIGDLETKSNPTVGLLAHPGNTDIRITAKAENAETAFQMIAEAESIIRQRLGNNIFGADHESLESVLADLLSADRHNLAIVLSGVTDETVVRLKNIGILATSIRQCDQKCSAKEMLEMVNQFYEQQHAHIGIGSAFDHGTLNLIFKTGSYVVQQARSFGGAPALVPGWASTTTLDFMRRQLLELKNPSNISTPEEME